MRYFNIYREFLLEEPKSGGAFTKCLSPDRTKDPGGVNLETGVYHNLKDNTSLPAVKYYCQAYGIGYEEARLKIRFLLGHTTSKSQELLDVYNNAENFGKLCREYCTLRGISEEVAKEAGLKETHDSILFPYFDIHGNLFGVKIRDSFTGSKRNEEDSFNYLYITYRERKPFPIVVLVEGESDALKFRSVLEENNVDDIGVYGLPGSVVRWEYLRELQFASRIVVIPDTDAGGVQVLRSVQKLPKKIFPVELPWKPGQYGKDVTDWLDASGNHLEELLLLIRGSASKRQLLDIENWLDSVEEEDEDWLIENLIAKEQIVLLGGLPKGRKTWIALNMIYAMVYEENFLGIPKFKGRPGYKIWFIEEEGSKRKFKKRLKKVFPDIKAIKDSVIITHRQGYKFDNEDDMNFIKKMVEEKGIDLIIGDPFQRLNSVENEDSSSSSAPFWDNVHSLLGATGVSLVLLHHFSKSGNIANLIEAFRGSVRGAGEVDLMIGTDATEFPPRNRINMLGRDTENIMPEDGEFWKVTFNGNTGLFSSSLELRNQIIKIMESGEELYLTDLQDMIGTQKTDVAKNIVANDPELSKRYTWTKPSKGNKVKLITKE